MVPQEPKEWTLGYTGSLLADGGTEARRDLAAWLARRQGKYPKVTDWVDEDIGSILSVYCLPRQHHQDLKNSSMLERLDAAIHTATRD
jgi:putative transposase